MGLKGEIEMLQKVLDFIKPNNSDPSEFLKRYKAKKRILGFLIAVFRILVLSAIGYVVIYPMLSMISVSFKSLADFSTILAL